MSVDMEKQRVAEKKPVIFMDASRKENASDYGRFIWEPLERGYGITLGNSLRRVLLSSLPGAAVTSIKIEGVLHEFSTIKGVLEDVTEIVLNIKSLRLKMMDCASKTLRIEATGERTVKASDIIATSEVEVLNPDLHIATLEKGAVLKMEMVVECGQGYVPADKNKSVDKPIGTIPIDAIFSPIKKVNYTVSDTRVGNVTNYDKLMFEIWTDGSMTPEESISVAADILLEKFGMVKELSNGNMLYNSIKEDDDEEDDEVVQEVTETTVSTILTIEDLDLSVRAFNCLKRANLHNVEAICKLTNTELKNIRNLGSKSIDEIKQKLQSHGLSLAKDPEEM